MGEYRETCRCGHDKATHFVDPTGKSMSCLGLHCNDCKRYRDVNEPITLRPPPYPWASPSRFPW